MGQKRLAEKAFPAKEGRIRLPWNNQCCSFVVHSAPKRILIEANGHLRLDRKFSPGPGMPHPRQVVSFPKRRQF